MAWLVAGFLLLRMAYYAPIGLVKLATGAVGVAGWMAAGGLLLGSGFTTLLLGTAWAGLGTLTGLVMLLRNHQSAELVVALALGGALLLIAGGRSRQ